MSVNVLLGLACLFSFSYLFTSLVRPECIPDWFLPLSGPSVYLFRTSSFTSASSHGSSSIHYSLSSTIQDATIRGTAASGDALRTSISFVHGAEPAMLSSALPLPSPSRVELRARAQTTVPPEVIGYSFTQGVWSSFGCLTGTWYEVNGYGRCCPETHTDCPVYTQCSGSVMFNDQFRSTCTGIGAQTQCIIGTVYETIGDPNPKYYMGCWPYWTGGNWDATRITETSNTTSSPSNPSKGNGTPPGVIAAIVLGALAVLLSFIALAIWLAVLYRRRKQQEVATSEIRREEKAAQTPPPFVPLQYPQQQQPRLTPPRSTTIGGTTLGSPPQVHLYTQAPNHTHPSYQKTFSHSESPLGKAEHASTGSSSRSSDGARRALPPNGRHNSNSREVLGSIPSPRAEIPGSPIAERHELAGLRSDQLAQRGGGEEERATTPYADASENLDWVREARYV